MTLSVGPYAGGMDPRTRRLITLAVLLGLVALVAVAAVVRALT